MTDQSIEEEFFLPQIYHHSSNEFSKPIDDTELGGRLTILQEDPINRMVRFSVSAFSKPVSVYPFEWKDNLYTSKSIEDLKGQSRQKVISDFLWDVLERDPKLGRTNGFNLNKSDMQLSFMPEKNPFDINAIHILLRFKSPETNEVKITSIGYVPAKVSSFFRPRLDWIGITQFDIHIGKNNLFVPVVGFYYEKPRRLSRFSRIDI